MHSHNYAFYVLHIFASTALSGDTQESQEPVKQEDESKPKPCDEGI